MVERVPGGEMTFAEWTEANRLTLKVIEREGSPAGEASRYYAHFDRVETKGNGVLIGEYGNGATPEQAIAAFAAKIAGKVIVHRAFQPERREIQCPNEWRQVAQAPRPDFVVPPAGTPKLCIVCAYEKPWGNFCVRTGAAVCEDCRDARSKLRQIEPRAGELAALRREHGIALTALRTIAEWALPDTGKSWPGGLPMSYGSAFGSNGEREYMRGVAREALAATPCAEARADALIGRALTHTIERIFAALQLAMPEELEPEGAEVLVLRAIQVLRDRIASAARARDDAREGLLRCQDALERSREAQAADFARAEAAALVIREIAASIAKVGA